MRILNISEYRFILPWISVTSMNASILTVRYRTSVNSGIMAMFLGPKKKHGAVFHSEKRPHKSRNKFTEFSIDLPSIPHNPEGNLEGTWSFTCLQLISWNQTDRWFVMRWSRDRSWRTIRGARCGVGQLLRRFHCKLYIIEYESWGKFREIPQIDLIEWPFFFLTFKSTTLQYFTDACWQLYQHSEFPHPPVTSPAVASAQ